MYKIILLIIIIILIGVFFYYTKTHNIKEGLSDLSTDYQNNNPPFTCGNDQYIWSWFHNYQVERNGIDAAKRFLSIYENNKSFIDSDSKDITNQWSWAYKRLTLTSGGFIENDNNVGWGDLMLMQYGDSYVDVNCDDVYRRSIAPNLQNIFDNNFKQGFFIVRNTPFSVAARHNVPFDAFISQYRTWTNVLNNYSQQINNRYHLNNCDTSVTLGGDSAPNSSFDNITSVKNCTPFQQTYANSISKAYSYKNGVNNSDIDAIASVDFNTYISSIFPSPNTFNGIQNALGPGVINKFKKSGNTCYPGSQLDINGIQECFGPDPSNNPTNTPNATGAYTNALAAYQNVMNTYLYTTTTDITEDQLITLQRQLDSSFSIAISGGEYNQVLGNLNTFTNNTNKLFNQNCNTTTRLDASGIYKCFGGSPFITSRLGQLQSSCQDALRLANQNQDIGDLPTLYNSCSNFFRNNLLNNVADVSQNISEVMAYNQQVISNNTYYSQQLTAAKEQTCKQNDPIAPPVSNVITNTISVYNENLGPYLDGLISDLTNILDNLPNKLKIDNINTGVASSNPFIKIESNDNTNTQTISFTVPKGNQGKMGPNGPDGNRGFQGSDGEKGSVGNIGAWAVPVQYEGRF